MTKLLTIEREYGAGAGAIAQKLAERLGWKLWDQRLTDEIARRLQCDPRHVEKQEERNDPFGYRLLKAFMRGSFEGNLNTPQFRLADAAGIREMTQKVVKEKAAEGDAVIVGRGAAYYLCHRTDAFHVFIYAPFGEKVRRLQRQGKSESEAKELVQNVDQDRTAFIKEHFDLDWPSRQYFHMMVNSTVGEEAAVEMIIQGMMSVKGSGICPEPTG